MDTAGQGTQGEDTNKGVEDAISEKTYVFCPYKGREDSNELEKDTESEDTDIADNDRSEDTDEYGGSDDTDIAVHIT